MKTKFIKSFNKTFFLDQLKNENNEIYLIIKDRYQDELQINIIKVLLEDRKDHINSAFKSNLKSKNLIREKSNIQENKIKRKTYDIFFLSLEIYGRELKTKDYDNLAKHISENIDNQIRINMLPILNRLTFFNVSSITKN